MERIKEAIKGITEQYAIDENNQVNDWLQTTVDLMRKVVDIGGVMPPKRCENGSQIDPFGYYPQGFNECREQAILAIAGGWVRKESLEEQQRINNLVLADKCDELDKFAERSVLKEDLPSVEEIAKTLYELEHPRDRIPWENFGNHSEVRESYMYKAQAISARIQGGPR